jgi:hypothetical protein
MTGFLKTHQESDAVLNLPWKETILRAATVGARRWLYLAAPVAIWLALEIIAKCSEDVSNGVTMIFLAILFIAGLPTSVLLQVDTLRERYSISSPASLLLCVSAVALVNIVLVCVAVASFRKIHRKSAKAVDTFNPKDTELRQKQHGKKNKKGGGN